MARFSKSRKPSGPTEPELFWSPQENRWGLRSPWIPNWSDFNTEMKSICDAPRFIGPDTWYINDNDFNDLVALIKKYHRKDPVIFGTGPRGDSNNGASSSAPAPQGANPWREIFSIVGPETGQKIYRLAASKLHPDMGGSASAMSLLNIAYDEIKG